MIRNTRLVPGVGAMGCVSPGGLGDGGGQPGGLGDGFEHWGQAVSGGEPGEGAFEIWNLKNKQKKNEA